MSTLLFSARNVSGKEGVATIGTLARQDETSIEQHVVLKTKEGQEIKRMAHVGSWRFKLIKQVGHPDFKWHMLIAGYRQAFGIASSTHISHAFCLDTKMPSYAIGYPVAL